jgi:hypothetical protein
MNRAERLNEIADYFMEHESFPPNTAPFDYVLVEAWPSPPESSQEPWLPTELRFSGQTGAQTIVTSRPWKGRDT